MQFDVKSGGIVVTDPCYVLTDDSHCIADLKAKNGVWTVTAVRRQIHQYGADFGLRVVELLAAHEDADDHDWSTLVTSTTPIKPCICVDSGQAGFFDRQYFIDQGEDRRVGNFYNDCMNTTLGKSNFGVIDNGGVVSRSGLGDGMYDCFAVYNKDGQVVALRLVFISKDEDDE